MSGRIYVTGDCHQKFDKLSTKRFPLQKELDKADYLIICGDFGAIWDRTEESDEEKAILDLLEKRSFTTLFLDGNHENFERLTGYPEMTWNGGRVHQIRPTVLHLMRGQVFEIAEKKLFTFGGAQSHDIQGGVLELDDPDYRNKVRKLDRDGLCYRINHLSWWKEELPAEEEMKEGIHNLSRHDYRVDYILTHCCSTSSQDEFSQGFFKGDILTDYLETIKEKCTYTKWYFGHYHEDRNVNDREVMLYHSILEIGDEVNMAAPVAGHPRYGMHQMVMYRTQEESTEEVGLIAIIDRWGTFEDDSQPSYDIWGLYFENDICLYKHIPEVQVREITEEELSMYQGELELIKRSLLSDMNHTDQ